MPSICRYAVLLVCQSLIAIQGAFEDDDNVYLVMELCEGGSLLSRVAKGRETERGIANIARSILRFIAQCHARVGHTSCEKD